ncbi:hypothetical protein C361_00952 [Cryptococcus neoformans Tu259-1]|uniref:Uncharacterized protein n=1 Tax=Cryptococcus neoformans Tu259-1 TaxID=1230072 RepID=A0A854QLH0_CRYNE|nr:hypothetical protein C361_00952 [Cryptococcus neoformans var. grubii Tu259-1]
MPNSQTIKTPERQTRINWSKDPQLTVRLLKLISHNPTWKNACFGNRNNGTTHIWTVYRDVALKFFAGSEWAKGAVSKGLVVQDDRGRLSATSKWTSQTSNPVQNRITSLKNSFKGNEFETKHRIRRSWKKWDDILENDRRHRLKAEFPYYFLLLELMVPPPSEDEVDELEDDDDYDIIPLSKIKEETREEIDELEDGDVHISGEEVRAKNPDLSTVNRVLYSPYEEKEKATENYTDFSQGTEVSGTGDVDELIHEEDELESGHEEERFKDGQLKNDCRKEQIDDGIDELQDDDVEFHSETAEEKADPAIRITSPETTEVPSHDLSPQASLSFPCSLQILSSESNVSVLGSSPTATTPSTDIQTGASLSASCASSLSAVKETNGIHSSPSAPLLSSSGTNAASFAPKWSLFRLKPVDSWTPPKRPFKPSHSAVVAKKTKLDQSIEGLNSGRDLVGIRSEPLPVVSPSVKIAKMQPEVVNPCSTALSTFQNNIPAHPQSPIQPHIQIVMDILPKNDLDSPPANPSTRHFVPLARHVTSRAPVDLVNSNQALKEATRVKPHSGISACLVSPLLTEERSSQQVRDKSKGKEHFSIRERKKPQNFPQRQLRPIPRVPKSKDPFHLNWDPKEHGILRRAGHYKDLDSLLREKSQNNIRAIIKSSAADYFHAQPEYVYEECSNGWKALGCRSHRQRYRIRCRVELLSYYLKENDQIHYYSKNTKLNVMEGYFLYITYRFKDDPILAQLAKTAAYIGAKVYMCRRPYDHEKLYAEYALKNKYLPVQKIEVIGLVDAKQPYLPQPSRGTERWNILQLGLALLGALEQHFGLFKDTADMCTLHPSKCGEKMAVFIDRDTVSTSIFNQLQRIFCSESIARMDSLQELQQCDGPYNEFFFITNDARAFNGIGVPGLVSRLVKVKRPIQFVEIYRIYRNRERSRQEAAKRDGGWRAHHELRGDRQID